MRKWRTLVHSTYVKPWTVFFGLAMLMSSYLRPNTEIFEIYVLKHLCVMVKIEKTFCLKNRNNAHWSIWLEKGWQNCPKKFRRLFNGSFPTCGKRIKAHVCLQCRPYNFMYMCTFPYLAYRSTLSPNFLIFEHFWDFWSWFKGVIHALKMFKNPFLHKIYPKASKKLKFTSICSNDQAGFVISSNHCAMGAKSPML